MAKPIINGDHLTSAEWDVLGKETGRLRYQGADGSMGAIPCCSFNQFNELHRRFRMWDIKPRIFREFEGGEIEITKDVWK